jgi:hypothetical protein
LPQPRRSADSWSRCPICRGAQRQAGSSGSPGIGTEAFGWCACAHRRGRSRVSAVLLASAAAFGIVKALGTGYLIHLGIRTLFGRPTAGTLASAPRSSDRLFMNGVLVSVLNPKIAVFFLAFLPQFVEPSRGPVPQNILLLGLIYIMPALITESAYALLAGTARPWLRGQAGQEFTRQLFIACSLCSFSGALPPATATLRKSGGLAFPSTRCSQRRTLCQFFSKEPIQCVSRVRIFPDGRAPRTCRAHE